jgi:hypothetical protein
MTGGEDKRERRKEKRLRDLQAYMETGIVQPGMGVRVPLMMRDSDKDVHWVMPVDHPLHATHARPMPERIADEAPNPTFDPRMHQPGYRTAQQVADSLASLTADQPAIRLSSRGRGASSACAMRGRIASSRRAAVRLIMGWIPAGRLRKSSRPRRSSAVPIPTPILARCVMRRVLRRSRGLATSGRTLVRRKARLW